MENVQKETGGRKKSPAILIAVLTVVLLAAAGSVSAFFLLNKSPKVQYLLAETKTLSEMSDLFKDRYENEVNWADVQKTKPVETSYDLSAQLNGPALGYEMQEMQSILNNLTISYNQVKDPVQKEWEMNLSGKFGSVPIDVGSFYFTPEKMIAKLSFTDKLLLFKDEDYGKMMRESDPSYDGSEKIGLSHLFEERLLTEELQSYIEKEYKEYLYNELPEEAFTSEKEEVEVLGDKIKAEKLEMKLSEKQVKTFLKNLLQKTRDDEKLKALLKEQIAFSTMGEEFSNEDLKSMIRDFEDELDTALQEIDELHIPEGITSTIWQKSNSIVKRNFAISIGDSEDNITNVKIEGVQLLNKASQQWAYTFTGSDSYSEEDAVVEFKGDLKWDGKKADDTITISAEDVVVQYKGEEELKGKERTFKRAFSIEDDEFSPEFIWSGTATHEKDSMKATHEFMFVDKEAVENDIRVQLKQQGKIVKKVDMPDESKNVVDLGSMTTDELESFFTSEIGEALEKWVTDLMGDLESELGNL